MVLAVLPPVAALISDSFLELIYFGIYDISYKIIIIHLTL